MICNSTEEWLGCYSGTFDILSPESMAHPAKMSPALCFKIIEHLEEMGLLKKGMTILDPMGGTGLTGICAAYKGYLAITVELEEKFVEFQKKNKEYNERKLHREIDWTILQGDSRYLSKILQEKGLVSVFSPPYGHQESGERGFAVDPRPGRSYKINDAYSESIENVGNLPDKPITVFSPPYENALPDGLDRKAAEQMVKAMYDKHGRTFSPEDFEYQIKLILKRSNRDYGQTDGQIGVLKDKPITVVSPPYANRVDDHGKDQSGYEGQTDKLGEYGDSEGQVGRLKDKPLTVMSPPYGLGKGMGHHDNKRGERPILNDRNVHLEYNDASEENIGNDTDESYLGAMKRVYSEIAKVSDVLAVVTKNPTRNNQLRRLDSDTIELLKQTGWNILCVHKAMLFHEHEVPDLFGNNHKKVKGRLSFFKRLSYQKGGVVADHEDVIIAVKENGGVS